MSFQRTPRGSTVLLLSAVLMTLGVLGTLQSQSVLLYAGVAIFLFYYTSKLLLQLKVTALDRLEISRSLPHRADEGDRVGVKLQLINRTFVRLSLEVLDSYPPLFRIRGGSNSAVIDVPAKGFCELEYELSPTSIGSQPFGPLRLVTRDIAGLFFYERTLDLDQAVEVTPAARELAKGSLSAAEISAYGGSLVSRRKGEGTEFADIRRYEPGDPYKRIHWKATAKTGQLMVRELQAETQLNVMIFLDSTETMAYGEAGRSKLDFSARAVASLVSYLSRRGDFVGMTLIQGDQPARVIPLARGQVQAVTILQALGALRPQKPGPEALRAAVGRCLATGRIKGRTLFFVISDLDFEKDVVPLRQLLAMNHEVVVLSPYSPLFEAHGLVGLDKIVYSIGVSHGLQTRRRLVEEANRAGIPVFDVGPDDLFSNLVIRVEELRRRGGS